MTGKNTTTSRSRTSKNRTSAIKPAQFTFLELIYQLLVWKTTKTPLGLGYHYLLFIFCIFCKNGTEDQSCPSVCSWACSPHYWNDLNQIWKNTSLDDTFLTPSQISFPSTLIFFFALLKYLRSVSGSE